MAFFLIDAYLFDLFSMISAPITPGTQPARVKINTMRMEPQPLSITASGGKSIERSTLKMDILFLSLKGCIGSSLSL